jgi:hypothetical protein
MFSSWVKSGHTTLKSKNDWVIVCPKVETRGSVPKNPNTWVTVEIGLHSAKTVTRSERGKRVAERLKHGRNVGKRCPDGRNVEKRPSVTVESAKTWEKGGQTAKTSKKRGKTLSGRPKRGETVAGQPKRRETGDTSTETGERAPTAPVHTVTVANCETSGKRGETGEKRGRMAETEEKRKHDARKRTYVPRLPGSRPSRWESGRNVGKTWPNGWKRVKNLAERSKRRKTETRRTIRDG